MKPSLNVGDIVRVSFENDLKTGKIVSIIEDPFRKESYLYKIGLNINLSYIEIYYTMKEMAFAKPLPNLF